MTPEEADQRIILSRQRLHQYADMTRAGDWPVGDLPLMLEEIFILDELAAAHPIKAQKIYTLGEGWNAMIGAVRGKLH